MASEPKIYSRQQLKEYILKKLGAPVINIEITDEQLDLAIDDTLDDFLPVAYSGVIERYIPVQLLEGVSNYVLPYSVFAVLGVHTETSSGLSSSANLNNLFSLNQFIAADLYRPGVGRIDLLGFELIQEMSSSINIIFSNKLTFDFNSISKILHIHSNCSNNPKALIHTYQKLDLNNTERLNNIGGSGVSGIQYEEENIYDERWIKRMAVARSQLQWGKNLMKYGGSVLPNGATLNAQFIYDEAKQDIEKYMEELDLRYALPPEFFVG